MDAAYERHRHAVRRVVFDPANAAGSRRHKVTSGESLEIGFNVSYLIDALSTVPTESVDILLTDAASSCLILPHDGEGCEYVVMPMRL